MTWNQVHLKGEISRFLQENGWKKQRSKDGKVIRFLRDERGLSSPVSVFFDVDDRNEILARSQVEEALATIRQFYGIGYFDLKHRVEALSSRIHSYASISDKLTTKVPDKYVYSDTVDLGVASSTIDYLRSMVKEAATLEMSDEKHSIRSARKNGREFAETCRFGHTFRGSFGFQIECPLSEAAQATFDIFDSAAPLGRRVSERMLSGLYAVDRAFKVEDVEPLVSEQAGFNAAMYQNMATYLEKVTLSSIDMGVEFNRYVESEREYPQGSFSIKSAVAPLLREAVEKLAPTVENEEVNVIGRVIALKSLSVPLELEDTSRRDVTVLWDSEHGRQNISFSLPPHQYAEAIRAHENGYFVQVRGMQKGRSNAISLVSRFAVLD